jgi:hypothetical protein
MMLSTRQVILFACPPLNDTEASSGSDGPDGESLSLHPERQILHDLIKPFTH